MKRDMDLIREALLRLSEEPLDGGLLLIRAGELEVQGHDENDVAFHIDLLIDAGLVGGSRDMSSGFPLRKITWAEYDFLDAVKDDDTWLRTKGVAKQAGGFSVGLLKVIAVGVVKQKVREIGLEL